MSGENQEETGNRLFKKEQVVNIITSVLSRAHSSEELPKEEIIKQLTELHDVIEGLRQNLSALNASDISNTHIPSASDELDAVIGATEDATNSIMKSSEKIMESVAEAAPDVKQTVEGSVIEIFEACTFQDITGQRIKKVVDCLKQIDTKTSSLLETLNGSLVNLNDDEDQEAEGDSLLNGPALPQNSVSQEDIDAILAEFDDV